MKFKADSGAMDSKNYLRLKDKDSVKGLFVGEPYEFRKHWVGNKTAACSEDTLCAHCAAGLKSSFGFRVNFLIKENETYVSKVFEQSWTTYEAMRNLNQEYDLEKHLVKISRSGSGPTDTAYSIIPVPNGLVTPELAKKLMLVPLQDIKHKDEPERIESKPLLNVVQEPAFDTLEEIPF